MRNLLLAAIIGSMLPGSLLAQAEENDSLSPRLREQQEKYERGEGLYPAKKRSKSRIGIQGGYSGIIGEVSQRSGITGALDWEKALGHVVSFRALGSMNFARGLDTKLSRNYVAGSGSNTGVDNRFNNPFLNSVPGGSYYNVNTGIAKSVVYNYASMGVELGAQFMFHLGNINYYNEANKWDFYAGVGPGVLAYNTMVDAKRRVNGKYQTYDFESVFKNAPTDQGKLFGKGSYLSRRAYIRKEMLALLKTETPGTTYNYESNVESDASMRFALKKGNPFGKAKDFTERNIWSVVPTAMTSVGLRRKLNDRFELGLEQRLTFIGTDYVDGTKFVNQNAALANPRVATLSRSNDIWSNTTLSLGMRLGKNATDALWWINPMNAQASSDADGRRMMKNLGEDSDGDGVADLFDKDPNTPEGTVVDGSGRTLDLDQDGVADGQDAQPFSPKGCPVDSKGVSKDSDNDGVPDCLDKENSTTAGTLVDNNGKAIVMPKLDCAACAAEFGKINPAPNPTPTPNPTPAPVTIECNLPSVHFDAGGTVIKQEFYPDLYYVAKYMMDHPERSIRVIGNDDKSETVARKRAEAAINFIVGNFGVDRNRFAISTTGGVRINAGQSVKNPKSGPLDYLNRRVDFECQ